MISVTMTPRNLWIYWKRLVFRNTFPARPFYRVIPWILIITRSLDDVVLASPKATFPISDHFIIQCPIGFPRPALSCKELTFRKLRNIDITEFSADIASSMLCASVHWDHRRTGRGGEGGCSPPKFWATQIFWAARENLGKARF